MEVFNMFTILNIGYEIIRHKLKERLVITINLLKL